MAPNALQGIWSGRPTYDQVPANEGAAEEMEERKEITMTITEGRESEDHLLEASSGSSTNGSTTDVDTEADAGLPFPREKSRFAATSRAGGFIGAALVLPTLAIRLAYLGWLMATHPLRRLVGQGRTSSSFSSSSSGSSPEWLALYNQLGMFKVLVPSFLHPIDPATAGSPPKKLHPTAWLDGLRGMAAFFVVWNHLSVLWFNWHIHNGYGINEHEHWLIQLPFLRLAISGPPMVAIFFVISGYALSYKPLKLSRMGKFADAYEAIGSSAFRRWPRLFFMPVVITFICACMTYLDWYGTKGWGGTAFPHRRPPRDGTFWGQLEHWWPSVVMLIDPFSKNMARGGRYAYDMFLWTLPVEFECSLMLFMCQAAFNRIRPNVRVIFMFGLAIFTMKYVYWQYFLFLCGMIVCDLQFAALEEKNSPTSASSSTTTVSSTTTGLLGTAAAYYARGRRFYARHQTAIGIFFFVLSLYILSTPEAIRGAVGTPGFKTMIKWVPQHHQQTHNTDYFWVPIGAALLVYTVDCTPALQRIFTLPFPQYLGKISYSMYLAHGPVLFTAGHWFVIQTTKLTGLQGQVRYGLGVGLSAIPFWFVLICLADLATRTLDKWSLSLGRLLYERLSWKGPEPEAVLPRTN